MLCVYNDCLSLSLCHCLLLHLKDLKILHIATIFTHNTHTHYITMWWVCLRFFYTYTHYPSDVLWALTFCCVMHLCKRNYLLTSSCCILGVIESEYAGHKNVSMLLLHIIIGVRRTIILCTLSGHSCQRQLMLARNHLYSALTLCCVVWVCVGVSVCVCVCVHVLPIPQHIAST